MSQQSNLEGQCAPRTMPTGMGNSKEQLVELFSRIDQSDPEVTDEKLETLYQFMRIAHENPELFQSLQPEQFRLDAVKLYEYAKKLFQANRDRVQEYFRNRPLSPVFAV